MVEELKIRVSIIERFEELIKNGKSLPNTNPHTIRWGANYRKWELSCLNILKVTFGEGEYYNRIKSHQKFGNREAWIPYGIACMESAKEEIEQGLLYKIEHLISADFFDSN